MTLSMTGFGRCAFEYLGKKITIDVKSLNSKSFDLNIRIPSRYKEKEFEIRKILSEKLIRGKVDCYINIEQLHDNRTNQINASVLSLYMRDLMQISDAISEVEAMKMAIRLPDVLNAQDQGLEESEWILLNKTLLESIEKLIEFRGTEGIVLQNELILNIQRIEENSLKIIPFESERIDRIKQKLQDNLEDLKISVDENRLHQELIFYVEKFDIAEEKVRLKQHLIYFLETLKTEEFAGKKLGFISQEIGREINTIGSKANHHEIQKIVILMKDDLEKIKEQLFNIL